MPNRYVREGIIESESVNSLSWQAEVFYRRLINRVDDFGRFHASPALLRSYLFPLQLSQVSEADIARLLAECEAKGLLATYHQDGKNFLAMNKWEHGRAQHSAFPDPPPHVNTCLQTKTYVCLGKPLPTPRAPARVPTPSPTPAPTPISIPTLAPAPAPAPLAPTDANAAKSDAPAATPETETPPSAPQSNNNAQHTTTTTPATSAPENPSSTSASPPPVPASIKRALNSVTTSYELEPAPEYAPPAADGTDYRAYPPQMAELHAAAAGIGLPASEIQRCYNHFAAQGWVRKNGLPVRNLKPLLSMWKTGFEERENTARVANPRNSGLHTGRTNFAALVAARQIDTASPLTPARSHK